MDLVIFLHIEIMHADYVCMFENLPYSGLLNKFSDAIFDLVLIELFVGELSSENILDSCSLRLHMVNIPFTPFAQIRNIIVSLFL